MDSETKAKLAGSLRQILGFLAGLAISKKWVDANTANTLIETAIGIVPVAMIFWSVWQKTHQTKIVVAAIAALPSATVEEVHAAVDAQK